MLVSGQSCFRWTAQSSSTGRSSDTTAANENRNKTKKKFRPQRLSCCVWEARVIHILLNALNWNLGFYLALAPPMKQRVQAELGGKRERESSRCICNGGGQTTAPHRATAPSSIKKSTMFVLSGFAAVQSADLPINAVRSLWPCSSSSCRCRARTVCVAPWLRRRDRCGIDDAVWCEKQLPATDTRRFLPSLIHPWPWHMPLQRFHPTSIVVPQNISRIYEHWGTQA